MCIGREEYVHLKNNPYSKSFINIVLKKKKKILKKKVDVLSMRNGMVSGNTRKKLCKKIRELLFNSLVN